MTNNNLCAAFLNTVERDGDSVALRYKAKGAWETITWAELATKVARFAGGLRSLGIERGDRVTLLIGNKPEFYVADLAALFIGAVPISLYQSCSPEQIADLREQSKSKLHITEEVAATIDAEPLDLVAAARAVQPSDLATVIFTSGTTSKPKGVMLTHANVVAVVRGAEEVTGIHFRGLRVVSYLPLAHIAERANSYYLPVVTGMAVTTCPNPAQLGAYLVATKPHVFFGVPRVWEKLYSGAERGLKSKPLLRKAIDAIVSGGRVGRFVGTPITKKLLAKLGLDECLLAASGAAPLSPSTAQFFAGIGVPFSEIYGMSETTGALAWSPRDHHIGSVGKAMPGTEIRLLPDGEIIARGATITPGYLDDAEATAAAFNGEWLYTGDIGEFDSKGRLKIVDRKKDLIITSGGKNISPAALESALESHPAVAHACVIGDRRAYVSALIVLDPEYAGEPLIKRQIEEHVAKVNAGISQAEKIKRHTVVTDVWTPNSDVLTPTMKVKRRGVEAQYGDAIEAMYGATTSPAPADGKEQAA